MVLYQLSYDPIRSGSDTVEITFFFVKIYFPSVEAKGVIRCG